MGTTELQDVQALLERVLPDPSGFAERLLQQVMARWAQSGEPPAAAFYTTATAQDVTGDDTVLSAGQPDPDEPPIDTNLLVAAAVGACECWGLQAGCRTCHGRGSSGWAVPDPELFQEFIGPAIARLSSMSADGDQRDGAAAPGNANETRHTAQGESE
jgi:hypothetical protein